MEIIIRAARKDEAAALAALAKTVWEEHYTPIIGPGQVRYMLERFQSEQAIVSDMEHGVTYLAAFDGNSPVAYAAYKDDAGNGKLFLSKLYVEKSRRGAGLARGMLKMAEAACRERGFSSIWLTVNRNNFDSIAAYKRLGFEKTGELVTDIGGGYVMDDYRMEKTAE